MARVKTSIHDPEPGKQGEEKVTPVFQNRSAAETKVRDWEKLLEVLQGKQALGAWCGFDPENDPEIYVIFADKLAPHEKERLTNFSDTVIDAGDDLLKKIVSLERENQYLQSLSLTDDLTGLYNYRFFSKQLQIEMSRTQRTGQPFVLTMIDLDNFKTLNDTQGHNAGNRFLVAVTSEMIERLRPTDVMCRYGGDEFAVIMPATTLHDAIHIAHRLRESVSEIPTGLGNPLSISLGLAQYDPASCDKVQEFLNLADKALYDAKNKGKNRLCYAGELPKLGKEASVTSDEKTALLDRKDRE